MDDIDAQILRLLQTDARLSNRELARRIGVAPSTALERVRALERRGIITGYRAQVNLEALGRGVEAFVTARVSPLSREVITAFQTTIAKLPEVLQVFVVAGDNDFLIHVAVPSIERLHAFLMDRLSQRREIVGFQTVVIFQRTGSPIVAELPEAAPVAPVAPYRAGGEPGARTVR